MEKERKKKQRIERVVKAIFLLILHCDSSIDSIYDGR